MTSFSRFVDDLRIAWVLSTYDFKLRYHASFLGYIWSWIKPLVLFCILYAVFSSFVIPRAAGSDQYALQLFLGIMVFTCFSEGTTMGVNALLTKSYLVTRTKLSRWVIVLSTTFTALLNFSIQLSILAVFFFFRDINPTVTSFLFVIPLVLMLVFCIMIVSFLLAPIAVRYRDVSMIWDVIREALFYATPIIYPIVALPESMQHLILRNPMGYVVHWSQQIMIYQTYPPLFEFSIMFGLLAIGVGVCVVLFKKTSRWVAEYV